MAWFLSGGLPVPQIRLAGGLSTHEGRVELNFFDHWGTVCDDGFNDAAATVACRMLGFKRYCKNASW